MAAAAAAAAAGIRPLPDVGRRCRRLALRVKAEWSRRNGSAPVVAPGPSRMDGAGGAAGGTVAAGGTSLGCVGVARNGVCERIRFNRRIRRSGADFPRRPITSRGWTGPSGKKRRRPLAGNDELLWRLRSQTGHCPAPGGLAFSAWGNAPLLFAFVDSKVCGIASRRYLCCEPRACALQLL